MLLIIAVTAIFVLIYFALLLPHQRDLNRLSRKVGEKNGQLRQAESILSNKDAIHQRLVELNSRLELHKKQFNTDFKTGAALLLLTSKAGALGVRITNLEPLGIVQHEYFYELPLKIELRGQFPAVVSFLAFCENLPNLAEIRRLEMEPVSRQAVTGAFPGPENPGEIKTSNSPQPVVAKYTLVIYSDPQPGGLPAVEGQTALYGQTGRENPFSSPAGLANGSGGTPESDNSVAAPLATGDKNGSGVN